MSPDVDPSVHRRYVVVPFVTDDDREVPWEQVDVACIRTRGHLLRRSDSPWTELVYPKHVG